MEYNTRPIWGYMGNDGKQAYNTRYYNLNVILSVGYWVNNKNAIRFRQWANGVLKQYLIKGYAANEWIRKQQLAELFSSNLFQLQTKVIPCLMWRKL